MLVKIPDEYAEDLKEMIELLKTQDNYGMVNTIYFVQDVKFKVDEYGEYVGMNDKRDPGLIEEKNILEFLENNTQGFDLGIFKEKITFDDLEDFFERNDLDWKFEACRYTKDFIDKDGECSIFEKDIDEHIMLNEHHYLEPRNFCHSTWRIDRMNRLRSLLKDCEILEDEQ